MTLLRASAVLVAGVALARAGTAQEIDPETLGHALGSPDAPLTVVELADFACSACAAFAVETLPGLRTEFMETGRVRWIVVPFDFGFRNSDEGARAAACAAQLGQFWTIHDALFRERDRWVGERQPADELREIAVEVGLSEDEFHACYEEDSYRARLDAATRWAKELGVRGTPTFLVGDRMVQGALPLDLFRRLVLELEGG